MKRPLLSALALAATLAHPALALDLDQMSDAERDAFRAEIRNYLLENPEVIMEAVAVLEQRQAEAQSKDDEDLVRVNAEDIFEDGLLVGRRQPRGRHHPGRIHGLSLWLLPPRL